MAKKIYIDHSAATYTRKEAVEAMQPYFSERFGNPSSLHYFGLEAKEALDKAREKAAKLLGCKAKEIIFTGSGTESCNLAVLGVARAMKKKTNGRYNHLITSKIEHHAVLEACKHLEKDEGFDVTYLNVDKDGFIDLEELKNAINEKTILVTIIYANNEVGTVQDIKGIAEIIKEKKKENKENKGKKENKGRNECVYFHTDACQAGSLLDIDVNKLGVDLMTLNGSKIYGPKGVGLLFVKEKVEIEPIIHGGGQENSIRSGTENVAAIVGFVKALELAQKEKDNESKRLAKIRDKLIKGVLNKIPDSFLIGHREKRLPNNANFSFRGVEGEALLLHLDNQGVAVSSGSACSSTTLEASHVLIAMNVPVELAHSSVRFSLGKKNTEEDIDYVLKVLPEIVKNLRKISPFYPKNTC